jgi:hypothetical protein
MLMLLLTFEQALDLAKLRAVVEFPKVLCFLREVFPLYQGISLVGHQVRGSGIKLRDEVGEVDAYVARSAPVAEAQCTSAYFAMTRWPFGTCFLPVRFHWGFALRLRTCHDRPCCPPLRGSAPASPGDEDGNERYKSPDRVAGLCAEDEAGTDLEIRGNGAMGHVACGMWAWTSARRERDSRLKFGTRLASGSNLFHQRWLRVRPTSVHPHLSINTIIAIRHLGHCHVFDYCSRPEVKIHY